MIIRPHPTRGRIAATHLPVRSAVSEINILPLYLSRCHSGYQFELSVIGLLAVSEISSLRWRNPGHFFIYFGRRCRWRAVVWLSAAHLSGSLSSRKRWPYVGSMLGHHQGRWPNIEPTLGQITLHSLLRFTRIPWSTRRSPKCWYNVGPASQTVGQHCVNIGLAFRVCCNGAIFVRLSLCQYRAIVTDIDPTLSQCWANVTLLICPRIGTDDTNPRMSGSPPIAPLRASPPLPW